MRKHNVRNSGSKIILWLLCLTLIAGFSFADEPDNGRLDSRIREARLVLEEMKAMPDTAIPKDLLEKCYGIAIFPSVIKGAFILGGQYGEGVLLRRDADKWSAPVFLSIGGASLGFQLGGQITDLVLVITNERGVDSLMHENVTLGGDVSIAAGPVGRDAEMATDVLMKTGIFSYSRNKGLFAGVSLKGAIVSPMKNLDDDYYGGLLSIEDILSGRAKLSPEASKLVNSLKEY
ncbi:MAG: lipid-binding SYLF domain-containing protein [Candidatus Omnitrophica bacterium]|nr:lipid-binding SYLF domain-containing protein [Candidatus Omnitrophota bacterium]